MPKADSFPAAQLRSSKLAAVTWRGMGHLKIAWRMAPCDTAQPFPPLSSPSWVLLLSPRSHSGGVLEVGLGAGPTTPMAAVVPRPACTGMPGGRPPAQHNVVQSAAANIPTQWIWPAAARAQQPLGWSTRSRGQGNAHPGACRAATTDSSGGELPAYELAAQGKLGPVDIAIEAGPNNSRCIWAGADVAAPAQAVYAALTSYEALGTFIPGLAENRCLERYPDGCKLLQVGWQDLALGFRFCARVCLRITEHPTGLPPCLLARSPNSSRNNDSSFNGRSDSGSSSSNSNAEDSSSGSGGGLLDGRPWPWLFGGRANACTSASSSSEEGEDRQLFSEQRFLRPRSPLVRAPPMDISFQLVEGDFAAFKGLWRVQSACPTTCHLSYTLFVRPQPWLLVGLIEQRVQDEIASNLAAVKAHVEAQMAAGAAGPPPPSLLG